MEDKPPIGGIPTTIYAEATTGDDVESVVEDDVEAGTEEKCLGSIKFDGDGPFGHK